ncbi:hypothetical protein [Burkholderia reimsis]|uniref:hypothetical protein n=1 Tax=Burkholderia reimsis TaxID=2234132 RepID=UPI001FCABEDD|nr:hypothetical protein [Burkholderia reimsis]
MTQLTPELLAVLHRPVLDETDLFTLDDFFELAEVDELRAQAQDRRRADAILHACAAELPALHPNRAALLALLGGAIVEGGADPRILFPAALARLGAWLPELAPFCARAVEDDDDGATDDERLNWHAARQRLDALDGRQGREIDALRDAVDTLVLPLMAMLMRDRDNHGDLVADTALQALLERIADNDSLPFDQLHFLCAASALSYEPECVVVLPASGTGFVASAHAVNNTFHAFTLLQRLIGEHARTLRVGKPIAPRSGDEDRRSGFVGVSLAAGACVRERRAGRQPGARMGRSVVAQPPQARQMRTDRAGDGRGYQEELERLQWRLPSGAEPVRDAGAVPDAGGSGRVSGLMRRAKSA